jgi:hypothetical protein
MMIGERLLATQPVESAIRASGRRAGFGGVAPAVRRRGPCKGFVFSNSMHHFEKRTPARPDACCPRSPFRKTNFRRSGCLLRASTISQNELPPIRMPVARAHHFEKRTSPVAVAWEHHFCSARRHGPPFAPLSAAAGVIPHPLPGPSAV